MRKKLLLVLAAAAVMLISISWIGWGRGMSLADEPVSISLTKTVDHDFVWNPGDPVTYTYEVISPTTNKTKISSVALVDNKIASLTGPVESGTTDGLLEPGEKWTYTATITLSETTDNTATVTVIAEDKSTASATATCRVEVAAINITKTPSVASLSAPGTVIYTYKVTNPLSKHLIRNITLSDDHIASSQITLTNNGDGDDVLGPGEEWIYTSDAIPLTTTTTNTATVTGYVDGEVPVTNSATATVTVAVTVPGPAGPDPGPNREINIVKTASPTFLTDSGTVAYDYQVSANCSVFSVTIIDDKLGALTPVSGDDGDGLLEPGETWKCSATATISATTTNTVTVTGRADTGAELSGTATATVTVTGTGTKSKPEINIVKTADPTSVDGSGTVTYDYQVSATGNVYGVKIIDDKLGALTPASGDDGDGVLEPGETWKCSATATISTTTTNTVTVTGYLSPQTSTTSVQTPREPDLKATASATVTVTKNQGHTEKKEEVMQPGNVEVKQPGSGEVIQPGAEGPAPALPQTGVDPVENSNLWQGTMALGLVAVLLFAIARRKGFLSK